MISEFPPPKETMLAVCSTISPLNRNFRPYIESGVVVRISGGGGWGRGHAVGRVETTQDRYGKMQRPLVCRKNCFASDHPARPGNTDPHFIGMVVALPVNTSYTRQDKRVCRTTATHMQVFLQMLRLHIILFIPLSTEAHWLRV